MFDEFRTMTVSAVGAHLAPPISKRTCLYLHTTLQIHWLMDKFVEHQFENHPVVQRHVVYHIIDNYMPRVEVEGGMKEVSAIRIKANEHDKAIELQASKLGGLRSDLNIIKKKKT